MSVRKKGRDAKRVKRFPVLVEEGMAWKKLQIFGVSDLLHAGSFDWLSNCSITMQFGDFVAFRYTQGCSDDYDQKLLVLVGNSDSEECVKHEHWEPAT